MTTQLMTTTQMTGSAHPPLVRFLPNPPQLDLSKPEILDYWHAPVPRFHQATWEKSEFWSRTPPVTAAQYVALRLGRPISWVSLSTSSSTSDRLMRARLPKGQHYEWEYMCGYKLLWARSHRDVVFRLDPRKVRKRNAPAALLAPLLEWATPEVRFERRLLLAGFPSGVSYAKRVITTNRALRRGIRLGYVELCERIKLPVGCFRPTPKWCEQVEVLPRRWKPSALSHGQLAIDAALSILSAGGEFRGPVSFETEADLSSAAGRAIRGRRPRGTVLGPFPDLVTTGADGARWATELISETYGNEDISEKHREQYEALGCHVGYVATSATVARRFARVTSTTCDHF